MIPASLLALDCLDLTNTQVALLEDPTIGLEMMEMERGT